MSTLIRGTYIKYKNCLRWSGVPHEEMKLERTLIKQIIAEGKSWMLQNCYDWDCKYETNFWYIIKDSYDETLYSKKVRRYIQKANDKFEIGLIPKQKLAEEGLRYMSPIMLNIRFTMVLRRLKILLTDE